MKTCDYSINNSYLCADNSAISLKMLETNEKNNNKVLFCNQNRDNEINSAINNRIFPPNKLCVLPDYRPRFKVCDRYVSQDTKIRCPKSKNTEFNPGKGSGVGYLANIDIDSDLRIGYRATLCKSNKYIQPICDRIIVDNPYILSNPTCENYKYYSFPPIEEKYKGKCGQINSDTIDIKYNLSLENKSCAYEGLNQTEMHIKSRQPIPEQYKSDMVQNDKLQMGPERTLHRVENVWSNFTRRKHI